MCGEAALCERLQSNINRSAGRKRHVVNWMQAGALREKSYGGEPAHWQRSKTWHSKKLPPSCGTKTLYFAPANIAYSAEAFPALGYVVAALLGVIANRIMCTSKVFVKWMSCSAACLNMCVTNLPCSFEAPPPPHTHFNVCFRRLDVWLQLIPGQYTYPRRSAKA